MNDKYLNTIKLLQGNYEDIRRSSVMQGDLTKHLVSLNYALNNKTIDLDKLKTLVKYFKDETKTFSPLRSPSYFSLLGMMFSESDDPEGVVDFMIKHVSTLKGAGFTHSTFLGVALYTITQVYEGNDVQGFAEKAMVIFKEMKKNHPVLTSGDDYALAILLASCSHHPDSVENYYTALSKYKFVKCNGLQMLSHILAYHPTSVELTVEKCVGIAGQLKENKLKIAQTFYPAIGLMSLLDQEHIDDVIEIAQYLLTQKRYKWLGKGMNIMIAAGIVCNDFVESNKDVMNTSMQVTLQAITSAQQAARLRLLEVL